MASFAKWVEDRLASDGDLLTHEPRAGSHEPRARNFQIVNLDFSAERERMTVDFVNFKTVIGSFFVLFLIHANVKVDLFDKNRNYTISGRDHVNNIGILLLPKSSAITCEQMRVQI